MNVPENAPTSLASQLKLDAHWMPYTANRNFQRDPRLIVAAEGSWLTDDKGRKVYDSLSGLWTCGAGHTRKEITGRGGQAVGYPGLLAGLSVRSPAVVPVGRENTPT